MAPAAGKRGGGFTSEALDSLKEELLQRKRELWQEIVKDIENDAGDQFQELIRTVKDQGDDALADLRESTIFSLIELKARQLEKIESTVNRIEEGAYGLCMDCGNPIKSERLKVLPHAVRCLKCQEGCETLNRAGGPVTC
jgi:DnaK suppressor protein